MDWKRRAKTCLMVYLVTDLKSKVNRRNVIYDPLPLGASPSPWRNQKDNVRLQKLSSKYYIFTFPCGRYGHRSMSCFQFLGRHLQWRTFCCTHTREFFVFSGGILLPGFVFVGVFLDVSISNIISIVISLSVQWRSAVMQFRNGW